MKKSISIRWVRSLHASVDGVYDEYVGLLETVDLLKNDLETRPRSCHLQINKEKKRIITDTAERYVKAMIWNIRVC